MALAICVFFNPSPNSIGSFSNLEFDFEPSRITFHMSHVELN